MNLSLSLKIRVTVFGATCSQAKLAPDIPTSLFESLSKWKQSQWSKPAVRETRGEHGELMNNLLAEQLDLNT